VPFIKNNGVDKLIVVNKKVYVKRDLTIEDAEKADKIIKDMQQINGGFALSSKNTKKLLGVLLVAEKDTLVEKVKFLFVNRFSKIKENEAAEVIKNFFLARLKANGDMVQSLMQSVGKLQDIRMN
jgi:hypothetical protein